MFNIAIIGAGGVAECHLEAASRHPQANVMYICDVRLDRARLLAERYGIPEYSADAKRAMLDTRVDAVILALPTYLHYDWIVRCTDAKKHVLTEKPICRTLAQARDAIELCEARGVRLAVGYMRRFSPARLEVRSLVQSGALGRPVTWTITHLEPRSDHYRGPNNWMWDRDRGGGIIMDGSIHDFDFACWVLGPPHRLYARSGLLSDAVTAPTQGCALVSFREGDTLVYSGAWQEGDLGTLHPPQSIVGPRGTIVLESDFSFTWHHAPGEQRTYAWDSDMLEPGGLGENWLFYQQLDCFIRGEASPSLATGEEALPSLWMSDQIVEAGQGRLLWYPS